VWILRKGTSLGVNKVRNVRRLTVAWLYGVLINTT